MTLSIFEFDDYKLYLLAEIDWNAVSRGYQTKLANAAKCHRSYLSQVLKGKQHLNPEHGLRLTEFFGMPPLQAQYFVDLIYLARAGDLALCAFIKERLGRLKLESDNLERRFKNTKKLDSMQMVQYYSSWHYGALHILAGLDGINSTAAFASHLNLPKSQVEATLAVLAAMGLVIRKENGWHSVPGHTYISNDSPLCAIHHGNWRQRAVLDSQIQPSPSIHYTSIQSHGLPDNARIKQLLIEAIDQIRKIVEPAQNEEVSCLCLDFFKVSR